MPRSSVSIVIAYNNAKKRRFTFTKPDNTGFDKAKWIESLNNWKEFIQQDQKKSWFAQQLEYHQDALKNANQLLQLVDDRNYLSIVETCELILTQHMYNMNIVDHTLLIPLGKQALGAARGIEMKHVSDINPPSAALKFTNLDFSSRCSLQ